MAKRTNLQRHVETSLKKFIDRFIDYAKTTNYLPDKELIAGAFIYLLDEEDLVPDVTPNIGYLDDLILFVTIAQNLSNANSSSPLISKEELSKEVEFIEKNKGLIYSNISSSIDQIRQKGQKVVSKLHELCDQVMEKYSNLGKE